MLRDKIKFLIQRFVRRTSADRDLQDELAYHLAADVRERIERGESPQAAREAALREFGNVGLAAEVTRDMWSSEVSNSFFTMHDMEFACCANRLATRSL